MNTYRYEAKVNLRRVYIRLTMDSSYVPAIGVYHQGALRNVLTEHGEVANYYAVTPSKPEELNVWV